MSFPLPSAYATILGQLIGDNDFDSSTRKELWKEIYLLAKEYLKENRPSPYEKRLTGLYRKLYNEGRGRYSFVYDLYHAHMSSKLNEQDIVDGWIAEVTPRYKDKTAIILEDDMCGMFPSSVETVPLDYYIQAEDGAYNINDTMAPQDEMDIDVRYSRARYSKEFYQKPITDDRQADNGFLSDQDHRSSDVSGYGDDGELPRRRYKLNNFNDFIAIHN